MAGTQGAELSKIDPELEALLKESPRPPPKLEGGIPALRQGIAEMQAAFEVATGGNKIPEGVHQEDMTVQARDGYQIPIRVYKPTNSPSEGCPLIVFLHGGGFCLGDLETDEPYCRLAVQKLGAVCVNVDYRLAPEHPFPTPTRDSWDAVKWAAANASKLGADPSKGFVICGTSAGGNQAAAIGMLARDEKLQPPITGLALLIPALMDVRAIPEQYKHEVRSYEQNADAPVLGRAAIDMFMANYKPDLSSTEYNIFAPAARHDGLPPTFLQICGMDPLRDEAIIFERVLKQHGTKTMSKMYPGLPHGFSVFFPQLKASSAFVQDTMEGIRWLLQQS